MKKRKRLAVIVRITFVLCLMIVLGCACGNSTTSDVSSSGSDSISTDATANKSLLTSFTGSNSVDIVGEWSNITFASSGAVTANISFDSTTNIATIVYDIGGNVYGISDPALETFTLDMTDFINNGTATFTETSDTHGDISVTLTFNDDNSGTFTGTAENGGSGTVTNGVFSGSFSISNGTVSFAIADSTFTFAGNTITCSTNISSTTIN